MGSAAWAEPFKSAALWKHSYAGVSGRLCLQTRPSSHPLWKFFSTLPVQIPLKCYLEKGQLT